MARELAVPVYRPRVLGKQLHFFLLGDLASFSATRTFESGGHQEPSSFLDQGAAAAC
jgi:hypothetical protein